MCVDSNNHYFPYCAHLLMWSSFCVVNSFLEGDDPGELFSATPIVYVKVDKALNLFLLNSS